MSTSIKLDSMSASQWTPTTKITTRSTTRTAIIILGSILIDWLPTLLHFALYCSAFAGIVYATYTQLEIQDSPFYVYVLTHLYVGSGSSSSSNIPLAATAVRPVAYFAAFALLWNLGWLTRGVAGWVVEESGYGMYRDLFFGWVEREKEREHERGRRLNEEVIRLVNESLVRQNRRWERFARAYIRAGVERRRGLKRSGIMVMVDQGPWMSKGSVVLGLAVDEDRGAETARDERVRSTTLQVVNASAEVAGASSPKNQEDRPSASNDSNSTTCRTSSLAEVPEITKISSVSSPSAIRDLMPWDDKAPGPVSSPEVYHLPKSSPIVGTEAPRHQEVSPEMPSKLDSTEPEGPPVSKQTSDGSLNLNVQEKTPIQDQSSLPKSTPGPESTTQLIPSQPSTPGQGRSASLDVTTPDATSLPDPTSSRDIATPRVDTRSITICSPSSSGGLKTQDIKTGINVKQAASIIDLGGRPEDIRCSPRPHRPTSTIAEASDEGSLSLHSLESRRTTDTPSIDPSSPTSPTSTITAPTPTPTPTYRNANPSPPSLHPGPSGIEHPESSLLGRLRRSVSQRSLQTPRLTLSARSARLHRARSAQFHNGSDTPMPAFMPMSAYTSTPMFASASRHIRSSSSPPSTPKPKPKRSLRDRLRALANTTTTTTPSKIEAKADTLDAHDTATPLASPSPAPATASTSTDFPTAPIPPTPETTMMANPATPVTATMIVADAFPSSPPAPPSLPHTPRILITRASNPASGSPRSSFSSGADDDVASSSSPYSLLEEKFLPVVVRRDGEGKGKGKGKGKDEARKDVGGK
ncbi:hypothetical protein EJ05DRAFT_540711 [Pseudovirgaria hyperparasitica]|uniref:Uncharacterized protein n=1 Tax=Pseudovirgaria hyperparasitica TaxID=470096 RepID=A0A6A6VYH6_9PEZI|nr:uncharacterized protein EJ05DRAFT_540711 [Pseudovirgaria hyperparasitica]KAF2755265.1 hypothetical protein EJ05DRAFT_540711 [Pseudovirgaria hyperparasitica]